VTKATKNKRKVSWPDIYISEDMRRRALSIAGRDFDKKALGKA